MAKSKPGSHYDFLLTPPPQKVPGYLQDMGKATKDWEGGTLTGDNHTITVEGITEVTWAQHRGISVQQAIEELRWISDKRGHNKNDPYVIGFEQRRDVIQQDYQRKARLDTLPIPEQIATYDLPYKNGVGDTYAVLADSSSRQTGDKYAMLKGLPAPSVWHQQHGNDSHTFFDDWFMRVISPNPDDVAHIKELKIGQAQKGYQQATQANTPDIIFNESNQASSSADLKQRLARHGITFSNYGGDDKTPGYITAAYLSAKTRESTQYAYDHTPHRSAADFVKMIYDSVSHLTFDMTQGGWNKHWAAGWNNRNNDIGNRAQKIVEDASDASNPKYGRDVQQRIRGERQAAEDSGRTTGYDTKGVYIQTVHVSQHERNQSILKKYPNTPITESAEDQRARDFVKVQLSNGDVIELIAVGTDAQGNPILRMNPKFPAHSSDGHQYNDKDIKPLYDSDPPHQLIGYQIVVPGRDPADLPFSRIPSKLGDTGYYIGRAQVTENKQLDPDKSAYIPNSTELAVVEKAIKHAPEAPKLNGKARVSVDLRTAAPGLLKGALPAQYLDRHKDNPKYMLALGSPEVILQMPDGTPIAIKRDPVSQQYVIDKTYTQQLWAEQHINKPISALNSYTVTIAMTKEGVVTGYEVRGEQQKAELPVDFWDGIKEHTQKKGLFGLSAPVFNGGKLDKDVSAKVAGDDGQSPFSRSIMGPDSHIYVLTKTAPQVVRINVSVASHKAETEHYRQLESQAQDDGAKAGQASFLANFDKAAAAATELQKKHLAFGDVKLQRIDVVGAHIDQLYASKKADDLMYIANARQDEMKALEKILQAEAQWEQVDHPKGVIQIVKNLSMADAQKAIDDAKKAYEAAKTHREQLQALEKQHENEAIHWRVVIADFRKRAEHQINDEENNYGTSLDVFPDPTKPDDMRLTALVNALVDDPKGLDKYTDASQLADPKLAQSGKASVDKANADFDQPQPLEGSHPAPPPKPRPQSSGWTWPPSWWPSDGNNRRAASSNDKLTGKGKSEDDYHEPSDLEVWWYQQKERIHAYINPPPKNDGPVRDGVERDQDGKGTGGDGLGGGNGPGSGVPLDKGYLKGGFGKDGKYARWHSYSDDKPHKQAMLDTNQQSAPVVLAALQLSPEILPSTPITFNPDDKASDKPQIPQGKTLDISTRFI